MSTKATNIVAYIGWIGWIIAICAGDKENCKVHLNNALLLNLAVIIFGIISVIPVVGWIIGCIGWIAWLVFWIMGLISAIQDTDKELPLIGGIKIIK